MHRLFFLHFSSLILSACGSNFQYVREAVQSSTFSETIVIDGEGLTLFSTRTGSTADQNLSRVFFIGGSGCTSLSIYLAPYFSGADAGLEVIGLDKRGVQKDNLGLSCAPAFWENYTYDEMLRRNLLAFDIIQRRRPDIPIALVGTPEGGPLALDIAGLVNGIAKVVVIGAGGMTQRRELEILLESRGASEQLQTVLARIDADPNNTEVFELG